MRRHAAGLLAAVLLTGPLAAATLDLQALWDFQRPEVSEQRFRDRLATASGDEALILQTQIARTLGLRRRFDDARAVLDPLRPQLAQAGAEAVVRWHLEWGRSWASATHRRETLPVADRQAARSAFRTAAERARAAGLDGLAVDALHMLPFTTADRDEDLAWTQQALDLALASSQPAAQRWEASLRHNLGITLNGLGRHEEALTMQRAAVVATERTGSPARVRIAHWMVARTLRLLQRHDEALAIQQRLERENAEAGTPDRYVFEELALLHHARGDATLAADYDARARR
jgi:tetratricopeptide (TPR) repeat protein